MCRLFPCLFLCQVDLIAHGKCHALRFRSNPNVAMYWTVDYVQRLFYAHIGEHVFAEYGLGVEIGRHEAALARERFLGRETLHVGRLDDVLEIVV